MDNLIFKSPRSVLITGCSSGIGRALACGLQQRGYHVIAAVRRRQDMAALRAQRLDCLVLDLANPGSIQRAVSQTLELSGGRLYGLVNNGAYGQPGAVEDLSRDALREQFETNLFGPHELTTRLLPIMRRQGHGRIVQISSFLGFAALPFRGAYNASKFALEGLSDTLRQELRGTNIHVVLIQPGPIRSRFRENALDALRQNIKIEDSVHQAIYDRVLARLNNSADVPFTLPAQAVLAPVSRALKARRPRSRYRVTVPAQIGRASCRERVEISVVAGSLQKKKKIKK